MSRAPTCLVAPTEGAVGRGSWRNGFGLKLFFFSFLFSFPSPCSLELCTVTTTKTHHCTIAAHTRTLRTHHDIHSYRNFVRRGRPLTADHSEKHFFFPPPSLLFVFRLRIAPQGSSFRYGIQSDPSHCGEQCRFHPGAHFGSLI